MDFSFLAIILTIIFFALVIALLAQIPIGIWAATAIILIIMGLLKSE